MADSVYMVTYRKKGEDGRRVLEVYTFKDVVDAIISLWSDDCVQIEVFRAWAL